MTADRLAGALLGLVLAAANYAFMVRIVKGMVHPEGKKLQLALLFVLKMVFLIVLVAAAFWWLEVSPEAFAIGYGIVIFVMIIKHLAESMGLLKK